MSLIAREERVELAANQWTQIADNSQLLTITNKSFYQTFDPEKKYVSVEVLLTESHEVPDDEAKGTVIGGFAFEIHTKLDHFTWARPVGNDDGHIFRRPQGQTADLPLEIIELAEQFYTLREDVEAHHEDENNPHKVRKEHIDLSDIPNDISDDPESNSSQTLATTTLTRQLYDAQNTHFDDRDNPHDVTKDQVSLGNVENFGIADTTDLLNQNCDNKYMTPKGAHVIFTNRISEVTINAVLPVIPQIIMDGMMGDYSVYSGMFTGTGLSLNQQWSLYGVSRESVIFALNDDKKSITVTEGLYASYVYDTEICMTKPFNTPIVHTIESSIGNMDGTYYVIGIIDSTGHLIGVELSQYPIRKIPYRTFLDYSGYTFCTGRMTMYNSAGEMVRRIGLGSIEVGLSVEGGVLDKRIVKVTPEAIGETYRFVTVVKPNTVSSYVLPFAHVGLQNLTSSVHILMDDIETPVYMENGIGVQSILYSNGLQKYVSVVGGKNGIATANGMSGLHSIQNTITAPQIALVTIRQH